MFPPNRAFLLLVLLSAASPTLAVDASSGPATRPAEVANKPRLIAKLRVSAGSDLQFSGDGRRFLTDSAPGGKITIAR